MINNYVLIVDDEHQVRRALDRVLKNESYHIVFAENGEDALDAIAKHDIHVVLTDLNMPEMNGLELLNRISCIKPDIIRLILSGNSESNSVLNAINNGEVYRYLLKPWDNDELKIIIRQAIDIYNIRQEKKILLQKLEEHNLKLEETVKKRTAQLISIKNAAEIGKHTSYIVHNIKNSIHGLSGALYLIEDSIRDEKRMEISEFIGIANETVENLKKTVAAILLYSSDRNSLESEQVDINELIRKTDHLFQMYPTYKHQVRTTFNLDENLPFLTCNPMHFRQILDNFFKYALDAMEDTKKKEFSVTTGTTNTMITLTIKDSGTGIKKEDLDKIFLPEFTTKPVGKGTGLGLASVISMVRAFKGSIDVRSELGQGTEFIIQLPFNRSQPE